MHEVDAVVIVEVPMAMHFCGFFILSLEVFVC